MINVTDKFKQAMKEPVKMVTASLVLDDNIIITGQDKLIKVTIDSSGHLFGTATSVINVELFGTDYNLVDHTFSVIAKTLVDIENDTWEEVNLGLFYVEESTADFEKKTTKIKGYDLMGKLAKTQYNSGTIQFPCTVKELINQLAEHFEFTVDTNLDNLPNITYQIPEDLYAKISNCTYRDILGEIAGATATIAVFNGKTLSFRDSKKKSDEDEIWTYDNLKTLKYNPKYGPVNSLVLARTPQEDNIAVSDNDSITANGLTEVKLANNEILDDDRRSLIDPIFNSIKGLSYYPFEAETTGLGWYKPGDLVSAQAGGGLMNGRTIGWLGQEKFLGKNLLKFNFNWTSNGISVKTNKDGRITEAKGTMTAGWAVLSKFYDDVLFPAGTYTFSVDRTLNHTLTVSGGYIRGGGFNANLNVGQTKVTFTASTPFRTMRLVVSDAVGTNINLGAFTPKLSLGDTPTDEPYIGDSVSAGYKNMFDEFSGLPVNKNGLSLINQDGVLKLSGTPDSDWIQPVRRDITGILMDNRPYTVVQYNQSAKFYVEVTARKKDGSGYDAIRDRAAKIYNFTANFTKYDQYTMTIMCGEKNDTAPLPLYGNFALYYGTFNENNLPEYTPYLTSVASPRPIAPAKISELIYKQYTLDTNLYRPKENYVSNGITHTILSDGTIESKGTSTINWSTVGNYQINLDPGIYEFSRSGTDWAVSLDSNAGGNHTLASISSGQERVIFEVTKKETGVYLAFLPGVGSTMNNIAKFSLKKTISAIVAVTNKNLLKMGIGSTSNGLVSSVADDGTVTYSGQMTSNWADITRYIDFSTPLPAGTYTLSIDHPRTHRVVFKYKLADGTFSEFIANYTITSTSGTFTTPQPIVAGYLFISAANGSKLNDTVKIQLEAGDVATNIVSYEEQKFVLPAGENLYKLTDAIYDEIKLENGVAKLIKRVKKLVLTGEENNFDLYRTTRSGTLGFRYYDNSRPFTQRQMISNIVCSHFESIDENRVYQAIHNKTGVSIYNSFDTWPSYADKLCFWFTAPDALNLGITDVASFKTWLKSEKAKGTPVTVYYEMKEPQITELGRTNLNQVYVTDTHLELGNGIKETIKGVAPTAIQTDYARAGGITKTIYNTEIKVDKQKQEIESIVSKQTQVDQQIAEEFSKITQNIKNVVTTIQTTGGGNLIKNSVGYAKNQDGTLVEWTNNNTSEVKSYTSPESKSYGAISGNAIELKKGVSITQRLNVASSGKIPYTLSFRCKKGAIGTATVKLSNTIDSFTITIPEGREIVWQNYDLTKLDPSMNYLDITVSTSNNCEQFLITDLMVNMGDQSIPWVQANGEILNTQVAVNDQGMMVSSSVYSGDYVQITPLGMSGHSNVTGTDEEVFKLNRDVTETSKLSARKEVSMDPIKIIPVKDGDMAGWNFVG
nr:MAG TPA: Minor structural protein putative tail fiber [Caudoviricetes sp.]